MGADKNQACLDHRRAASNTVTVWEWARSNWHDIPRISSWFRSPFDAVVNETCEDIPQISTDSLREGTGSSLPRQFLISLIIVPVSHQTGPHSERAVQVQLVHMNAARITSPSFSFSHFSFHTAQVVVHIKTYFKPRPPSFPIFQLIHHHDGPGNPSAASNTTNTSGDPSINAADTAQGPIYHCEPSVPPTPVLGPGGFPFTVRCIYDHFWPADLLLDRRKSNWGRMVRCVSSRVIKALPSGLAGPSNYRTRQLIQRHTESGKQTMAHSGPSYSETYPKAIIMLFPTYRSLIPSSRSSANAMTFLPWKILTFSRRPLTSVSTSTRRLARRSTKSRPFTLKSPVWGSWSLITSNVFS